MLNAQAMAGGTRPSISIVKGSLRPLKNRVIVKEMNFGEMKTKGGLILLSDDGKDHGIKPCWCQVVAKGKDNNDEYEVGDWILVEHGRWSRGYNVQWDDESEPTMMRTVEAESVLLWTNEYPDEGYISDK